MPGDDPVRFALLNPLEHRFEDRPARLPGAHGFLKRLCDSDVRPGGSQPLHFFPLGFDGEDLPVFGFGGSSAVEEVAHGSDGCAKDFLSDGRGLASRA